MSIYTRLFSENPLADRYLDALNLKREDLGRYRDIYRHPKALRLVLITRNGGVNRPYFQDVFDRLAMHPLIMGAYDDSFDSTYHYTEFILPPELLGSKPDQDFGVGPVSERFKRLAADVAANHMTADVKRHYQLEKELAPKMQELMAQDGETIGMFDSDTPAALRVGERQIEV